MLVVSLFSASALGFGIQALSVVSTSWVRLGPYAAPVSVPRLQEPAEEELAHVFRALRSTLSDCSYEVRVDRVEIEEGAVALADIAPSIGLAYEAAAEAPFSFPELNAEFTQLVGTAGPATKDVTARQPMRVHVVYTVARHVERILEPASLVRLRSEPFALTYWPDDGQLNLSNADGSVGYLSPDYLYQPLPVSPSQIEQLGDWEWQRADTAAKGAVYRIRGAGQENYYSYQTSGAPAYLPLACRLQSIRGGVFGYAGFYGYEPNEQGVLRLAGTIAVRQIGGRVELERFLLSRHAARVEAQDLILRIKKPKSILDERGGRITALDSVDRLHGPLRKLVQIIDER